MIILYPNDLETETCNYDGCMWRVFDVDDLTTRKRTSCKEKRKMEIRTKKYSTHHCITDRSIFTRYTRAWKERERS